MIRILDFLIDAALRIECQIGFACPVIHQLVGSAADDEHLFGGSSLGIFKRVVPGQVVVEVVGELKSFNVPEEDSLLLHLTAALGTAEPHSGTGAHEN